MPVCIPRTSSSGWAVRALFRKAHTRSHGLSFFSWVPFFLPGLVPHHRRFPLGRWRVPGIPRQTRSNFLFRSPHIFATHTQTPLVCSCFLLKSLTASSPSRPGFILVCPFIQLQIVKGAEPLFTSGLSFLAGSAMPWQVWAPTSCIAWKGLERLNDTSLQTVEDFVVKRSRYIYIEVYISCYFGFLALNLRPKRKQRVVVM